MGVRREIPGALGDHFRVGDALAAGVSASRLRGADLDSPFHGVRATRAMTADPTDPWAAFRAQIRQRARTYAPLLSPDQCFSHATAAALLGAPITGRRDTTLDVTTLGDGPVARGAGIRGHRVRPSMATVRTVGGLRVTSPASTWAMAGSTASVDDLVLVGDFLVRVWRAGVNRPHPGRKPFATLAQFEAALTAGRRLGAARLREALTLIRCDSWSPRETRTRLALIRAGLPEPGLNVDVFDDFGAFLGCIDLCYLTFRVAIEYQGQHHRTQYARDVERIERLREAGWIVIQVTSELTKYPEVVVRRARAAFRAQGWRP